MGNPFNNIVSVSAFLKSLLFIFNSIFWFTGAVLMVVGLWFAFDSHRFLEFSQEFSGTVPHAVVGVSCLAVAVTSIGYSIIVKGHHVSLCIYSGLMVCIFMMEMGALASVVCFQDTFAKSLHDSLTHSLLIYDPHKSYIGFAQSTLQCCGVSNYTDWVRLSPQRVVPATCCASPHRCVTANYSDLFHKGCYEAIIEFFDEHSRTLLGVAAATLLLPLLLASLSCCLGYYVTRCKYRIR